MDAFYTNLTQPGVETLKSVQNIHNDWHVKAGVLATIAIICLFSWISAPKDVSAPFVGYRSIWEPTMLVRARFILGAGPIVMNGYKTVSHHFGRQCFPSHGASSSKKGCSRSGACYRTCLLSPTSTLMSSDSCHRVTLVQFTQATRCEGQPKALKNAILTLSTEPTWQIHGGKCSDRGEPPHSCDTVQADAKSQPKYGHHLGRV
jgi:hypothetical protein